MSLVAYVLASDFGANKAGDVVHLDSDEAQPLVDAGILTEATSDDMGGDEDEVEGDDAADAPEQEAAITRSIKDGFKSLQDSLVKTAQVAASKKGNLPTIGNFATPKQPVFKGMGEQIRAIYFAKKGKVKYQNMIRAWEDEVAKKAPLGINEANQAQGGYAVLPEWADAIWDKARDYPRLFEKVDKKPVSGNTLYIVGINETSLVTGSRHGGVTAYWVTNEGDALTASYPQLQRTTHVLNTSAALAYISNQELEDIHYPLDSYLQKQVGNEFVWQENDAVCNGTGSGMPQGLLNQPALITVTKSASTPAGKFGFDDLVNMYKRLWAPSRNNAVWLMNPLAYGNLLTMQFPNAAAGTNIPAFGAFSYNAHEEFPFKIFGRPVIEVLNLPQVGLVGDIILADLTQLTGGEKPGMQVDVSDQVQFTTLQTAFRFVRRYDIRSPWNAPLTAIDGVNTYSPYVALASRGT